MTGILPDIIHAVGGTPLVRLNTIGKGLPAALFLLAIRNRLGRRH